MPHVALAETDAQILRCFPVIAELRPHLVEAQFVERVRRQQAESGYRMAFVEDSGVKSVAGFRVSEFLAWGKTFYVDDLVSTATDRSKGHGKLLFNWLVARARASGCAQFHLDSGVQRFEAHRFYLRERMIISSHHFSLNLT
jgi:GNAT superfamily N-acetyltransferase